MGNYRLLAFILAASSPAWAIDKILTDCKSDDVHSLRAKTTLEQVVPEAKLTNLDCAYLKGEKLLAVYVVAAPSGVESRLAIFSAPPKAKPIFVSDSIGFDSFPIFAKGKKRLLFMMPSDDAKKIEFYTVTQTGANETRLIKHEIDLQKLNLTESTDHSFPVDSTHMPKIFKEKGNWRAILKGKIIDL